MKVLVISMDNEKGQQRRSHLNYDYTQIQGCVGSDDKDPYVAEVKEKLFRRNNTFQKTYDGQAGAFASHIKALEHIINNGLKGVVICEDDAIQTRGLPEQMPDEICLLSGRLEHPKDWRQTKKWRKTIGPEITASFSEGVNQIDYDVYRWTVICAYWVPSPQKARELLDKLRFLEKWRAIDIMLSKHKLINQLYYPAIYKHHDKVGSNIQTYDKTGIVIDYLDIRKI